MAEMPETIATIQFAKGDTYHGLEVTMTLDITLDEALSIGTLTASDTEQMFTRIGGYLRGWNLTRKGVAVPCTATSLRAQPLPFVVALLRGYREALGTVMTVDDPFEPQSNATGG